MLCLPVCVPSVYLVPRSEESQIPWNCSFCIVLELVLGTKPGSSAIFMLWML